MNSFLKARRLPAGAVIGYDFPDPMMLACSSIFGEVFFSSLEKQRFRELFGALDTCDYP